MHLSSILRPRTWYCAVKRLRVVTALSHQCVMRAAQESIAHRMDSRPSARTAGAGSTSVDQCASNQSWRPRKCAPCICSTIQGSKGCMSYVFQSPVIRCQFSTEQLRCPAISHWTQVVQCSVAPTFDTCTRTNFVCVAGLPMLCRTAEEISPQSATRRRNGVDFMAGRILGARRTRHHRRRGQSRHGLDRQVAARLMQAPVWRVQEAPAPSRTRCSGAAAWCYWR